MSTQQRQSGRGGRNPLKSLIGFGIIAVILVVLYFVVAGIIRLLYSIIGPLLLIATLFIDYKVMLDYIKQLGAIYKNNFLYGLGATAFTVVLYPLVGIILFSRALLGRRNTKVSSGTGQNMDEEFVDYEEVEDLDLDEFGKIKETRPEDLSSRNG